MAYIDKISKNGTAYDVYDTRFSSDTLQAGSVDITKLQNLTGITGDAGDLVAINSTGGLEATDPYTGAAASDAIITTAVDANHVITATIGDGKVTKTKLASAVQSSLDAADAAVKSVNSILPDNTGNVAIDQVPVAENLYSPDAQTDTGTYILRTAGGDASISNGDAELTSILGNAIQNAVGQTITVAKPITFKAVGYNAYNATAGYAHVVGGNLYNVEGISSSINTVEFATSPTATVKTTINLAPTVRGSYTAEKSFTPAQDGYVWVTGAVASTTMVCLVWSGYMIGTEFQAYSENSIVLPTTDVNGTLLPLGNYGMPKVDGVADEINFKNRTYVKRIGQMVYSPANLEAVQAITNRYIYDTNNIFYVLPTPVTYQLASTVSGAYIVNDFGTEEFTFNDAATTLALTGAHSYATNLRDKLRTDVVTISAQNLSAAQKRQVNANLNSVSYVEQNLSAAEKAQATANIGAVPDTRKVNGKALSSDVSIGVRDIDGAVATVNNIAPIDGNVNVTHVSLADNLYSTSNIESYSDYTLRTSGGDESISTGDATLSYVRGNVDIQGRVEEVLSTATTPSYVSVAVDKEVWRASAPGQTSGTHDFVFTYNGTDWSYGGSTVSLSTYGLTASGLREESCVATPEVTKGTAGMTANVNVTTWKEAMENPEDGSYVYTWDGTDWEFEEEPITLADYGITAANVPANFAEGATTSTKIASVAVNTAVFEASSICSKVEGYYNFTYDGTNWKYNTETVNLATLGITLTYKTGETAPEANDVIMVNYQHAAATITIAFVNKTSSASITVSYTKHEQGTINITKPTAFTSYAMNMANPSNVLANYTIDANGQVVAQSGTSIIYARITGTTVGSYSGNIVYSEGKGITRVAWAESVPTAGAILLLNGGTTSTGNTVTIQLETDSEYGSSDPTEMMNVTVADTGYICVATATPNDISIHAEWSKRWNKISAATSPYSADTITLPTTGKDVTTEVTVTLPLGDYGMPSIGQVRDEMNFDALRYTKKIGVENYSAAKLAQLLAEHPTWIESIDYDWDTTHILYVLDTPVNYSLTTIDNIYHVDDIGHEEFVGATVPMYAFTLYGQNLADKLRTDVVTISEQTLTTAQKGQVRANLAAVASEDMADEFASASAYNVGDIVIKDNRLYTAVSPTSAGAGWTAANWSGTTVSELLSLKADKSYTGTSMTSYPNNTISQAVDALYNSKQSVFTTAGFHNSIVRGRDITSYFTDGSLWDRINGTNGYALFEDLYLGDYINMGARVSCQESDQGTSYGNIGSQYVTIAGFDTHLRNGNSDLNYHHLCMVPGQFKNAEFHFGRHRMNATNTTEGGYKGSVMHTTTIGAVTSTGKTYAAGGTINEQLYNIFGNHLKTTRELLSNAINASGYNRLGSNGGCSSGWEWVSCQAVLLSEVECYGSIVWSSSGYDTGNANNRLPLFKLEKGCMNNRSSYYWLKDVVSSSGFALCDDFGRANYTNASYGDISVRPRFLIS